MITEEQVATAENEAAEAARARVQAQDALTAAPHSTLTAGRFAQALQLDAQKAASATELREAYKVQKAEQQAAMDRGTLEKAAAGQIEAAGEDLDAARKAVVARAEAAQAALAALMAAVGDFNSVIETHATALFAAGLGRSGGVGAERPSGDHQLTGPVVWVKGREYEQVDEGAVAVWVTRRVGEARLPQLHPAGNALQFFTGVPAVEQRANVLFAGLSKPKKVQHTPIEWPRAANPGKLSMGAV